MRDLSRQFRENKDNYEVVGSESLTMVMQGNFTILGDFRETGDREKNIRDFARENCLNAFGADGYVLSTYQIEECKVRDFEDALSIRRPRIVFPVVYVSLRDRMEQLELRF